MLESEREHKRQRGKEVGELCSLVTRTESENSNLVITATAPCKGKGLGVEVGRDGSNTAGEILVC